MKSATLPDGFFLGQVPPNWTEYLQDGTWSDAHNNRVKVRIPGKHSKGPEILDKDLPWAIVSQSTSTGNRNGASTGLSGGEWVIGFYLDEDEQLPVIMQVLGRNEVSGAKIKASENGTTQFRDVSRFAGSTAQEHQMKGGPKPGGSAKLSKEVIKKGTQSPPPPAETGEELPGFVPPEEASPPPEPQPVAELPPPNPDSGGTGDWVLEPSGGFPPGYTPDGYVPPKIYPNALPGIEIETSPSGQRYQRISSGLQSGVERRYFEE